MSMKTVSLAVLFILLLLLCLVAGLSQTSEIANRQVTGWFVSRSTDNSVADNLQLRPPTDLGRMGIHFFKYADASNATELAATEAHDNYLGDGSRHWSLYTLADSDIGGLLKRLDVDAGVTQAAGRFVFQANITQGAGYYIWVGDGGYFGCAADHTCDIGSASAGHRFYNIYAYNAIQSGGSVSAPEVQGGGYNSSYPRWHRNGATWQAQLGDGSALTSVDIEPGGTVPAWKKYALVAIANGVNGCASANGCWQVNGVLGAAKAAALTQDVTLFTLPAKGQVTDWRVKTSTACTGATTAMSGLGVTTANTLFRAQTYDIAAAPGDTNLTTGPTAGAGANTAAATSVVASLVTTVQNVDQLVNGCAVDYSVLWAVLP